MAVAANHVAVDTNATLIYNAGEDYPRIVIKNAGATALFIGPSNVTTSTGYELAAGASLILERASDSGDDFYAICATTGTIHYLVY